MVGPESTLNYILGRYSGKSMSDLKQKLSQLPTGTRLELITTVAEPERHRNEFAEVERAGTADGLLLDRQLENKPLTADRILNWRTRRR